MVVVVVVGDQGVDEWVNLWVMAVVVVAQSE